MSSLFHRAEEAIGNTFSPSAFMPYINGGIERISNAFRYLNNGVTYGVHQLGTSLLQGGAALYAGGARFFQPAQGTFGVLAPIGRTVGVIAGTAAGVQTVRELGSVARARNAADRMLALTRAGLWGVTSAVTMGLSVYSIPAASTPAAPENPTL